MGLARRRDGADRSAEVAGTLVLAQSGLHATDRARTGFSDSESGPRGHGVRIEAGIGRRIGRYRLVEPLGAGSQAVVWRAVLGGTAGREVALKLLVPAQHINRCKIARLRREAARGQRLSRTSAAILPTLEFGVADGVVFMAMPLVEGCSLRDVILQRRRVRRGEDGPFHKLATLPPREYARSALGVLARITRALQVAHEARVAHRDVKPANILLEWRDEMRYYLTDFGLARDLDVATLEQLRDGAGTPMYMAPEKLQGRHRDEIRCDIYALGVTLYEALTLTPPFPVPRGLSGYVLMAYLALKHPRRPRPTRPALPRGLEAIILRATDPDPDRRYPTAQTMADDLERFLAAPPRRAVVRPAHGHVVPATTRGAI